MGGSTASVFGRIIRTRSALLLSSIRGVNAKVDIPVLLHGINVGVKMPELTFPFQAELFDLNRCLTFPVYLADRLSRLSIFFPFL